MLGAVPDCSGAEAEHPVLLASQQTLNGTFWSCTHWKIEVGAFHLSRQCLHKAPGLLLWWITLPPALLVAHGCESAAFAACSSAGFTCHGLAWDTDFSGMKPSHSAPCSISSGALSWTGFVLFVVCSGLCPFPK